MNLLNVSLWNSLVNKPAFARYVNVPYSYCKFSGKCSGRGFTSLR